MSIPTTFEFQVTWADLDANRHLKNTGYLDYAAQSRFLYFAAGGFGQQQFAELNIGPATLSETITYKRELRHLEKFKVHLSCSGHNAKGSKFVFHNEIVASDGHTRAIVETLFIWFDLGKRKSISAPDHLLELMLQLPKSDQFTELA